MRLSILLAALAFCANVASAQHDHGQTHISFKSFSGDWLMVVWGPQDEIIADALGSSLKKTRAGYELDISKTRVEIRMGGQEAVLKSPIEFRANGTDPVIGAMASVHGIDAMKDVALLIVQKREECQRLVGLSVGTPFLSKNAAWRVLNPQTGNPLCGEPWGDLEVLNKMKAHVAASIKPLIDTKQYKLANQVLSTVWPKN